MLAALIWTAGGWITPTMAGPVSGPVLTTPAGLMPGDQFRFVFVTAGTRDATSSNITDYDNFVQSQAGGATYNGVVVNWLAIGSTETVNAIDHVGVAAAPVYLVDGTEVTTNTGTTGLWSGNLIHAIDEDIDANTSTNFVWTGTQQSATVQPQAALGDTRNRSR